VLFRSAVTFVVGIVLLIKGFGIYNRLVEIRPHLPAPELQLIYVGRTLGTVVVIIGAYQGIVGAASYFPSNPQPFYDLSFWAGYLPVLIGHFIIKGIDLIVLGIILAFIGSTVYYYLHQDERLANSLISAIMAFWMRFIILSAADILLKPDLQITVFSPLVLYTVASILTTTIAVALLYRRYKKLPFT
jgi:hypothetical protein